MQYWLGMMIFICMTGIAWSAPRQEVSLNGTWEMVKVRSLEVSPPRVGWHTVSVPGVVEGYNHERCWFRRAFFVPEEWRGKQLFLKFGGVKYNSLVFVNGQYVGGSFNGYDAFKLDITKAVSFGAKNKILLGVHNWTGVFDEKQIKFPLIKNKLYALRYLPRDRILGPIGGRFSLYGIWDDVTLLAVPRVYFREVFMRPSVRNSCLEVDVKIINQGQKQFVGRLQGRLFLWDGTGRDKNGQWQIKGNPVAVLATTRVEVSPGKEESRTLRLDHPSLDLWWPHSPRLYVLELRFDNPDSDILRERMGFREFWTGGGDFYLNGSKVHLLSTSWWPSKQPLSRKEIASRINAIKEMNTICFRTHTQPWPRRWYEIADELGLLMIPEGAIYNDDEVYRVNDPRFWKNYATHLRSMVHHLRNHPSIIMWSLENEFYGIRAKDNTHVEKELARMGLIVKQEDPTRPIFYESDGDPGGISDVIGLHYPNEYPQRRLWPNDAFWLEAPKDIHGRKRMFWNGQSFLWERRKPLYIGEFLWVPSHDPSPHTLFYGDEAYKGYSAYRTLGKALAWKMQILAHRHYGVSGQSPWTVHEQGSLDEQNPCWVAQRDMYRPLAAFVREYDSRFFAGESVDRTIDIFNDTMVDRLQVQFRWSLLDGQKEVAGGSDRMNLASGEHREKKLRIPMPKVHRRRNFTLRLTLTQQGGEYFREEWPIEVFPRRQHWSLPNTPIFLYDPHARLKQLWMRDDVTFEFLPRLQDWNGKGVLVIGPKALNRAKRQEITSIIGREPIQEKFLAQRVEAGGRVLVLEQTEDASDWLPVQLSEQSSTMAFPQMPCHPILHDLAPEDFRWWRGDHLVSHHEPPRPVHGAMRPLVVTGTAQGISHAPLLEIPQGSGTWLLCQLRVVSKLDSEPIAHLLLERMLHYLASYSPPKGVTLCLALPKLQERLAGLGVECTPLKEWKMLKWPEVQLLILQSDGKKLAEHADKLRAFLEAGGHVFWHRPQTANFNETMTALDLPVKMQPYRGPVMRLEGEGQWLEALTREDLYWLDLPEGPRWRPTPLSNDTAAGIFSGKQEPSNWQIFEAERGVRLEGHMVRVKKGEVAFYTKGKGRWRITLPESGNYLLGLVARGTPVGEIYPIVDVRLNGKSIGTLNIGSGENQLYSLPFRAEAGSHVLTVLFTNDKSEPPEDRNLFVDRFMWSRDHARVQMESLTVPTVLSRLPVGKGQLILSTIRWDEPGNNVICAQRFICSLLTALGARFRSRTWASMVEAEWLEPQPHLAWFRREAGYVYMGTNGCIHGPVCIVQEGKYQICLWARGTPAEGEYPIVALKLNGRELGRIEIKSENWNCNSLRVNLPKGNFKLSLHFINDLYRPPEDRNLWIDRVEFEKVNVVSDYKTVN